MITRIQAVHFDASQQLQEFVEKKVSKLEKLCEESATLEVVMKLIKPETSMNKEVSLSLTGGGGDIFVSKVGDKFEDALLECLDALKVKIEKNKEKMR
ncbi:MAG: HPF/RaiA family ribosome-associated protein [Bacteroidaceae bacterium]|nr:HPF/RaiA family ribosome-associated protein [Bacteroidaceae bacterium]